MNSSIALRLLWKEYRVQRGLWLAMLIGCFVLQGIVTTLIRNDLESLQGIVPIALMLTFFYAIGSGSITFAIEREEGTQLRPVMQGCPTGLTLIVKTVFGIVTTAALLAITICSGMMMSLGSLTLPESAMPPDTRMIIPACLLFVVVPYLGGLLWSMFFSLLTRKVVVALGLTVVAMILSYMLVAGAFVTFAERNAPRHLIHVSGILVLALIPCFLLLVLLASNYLLTHRWLTRVFFDQSATKSPSFFRRWRIRRSGLDGGMTIEIGVEDRTSFEVVSPEVVEHLPPPRLGLSLLYVNWGPNLWRHLRFLRWKEALETRKLFVGFLLATLVLTIWSVEAHSYRGGWYGFVGFFIYAACVACGVMAFRTEQDDRKVQRLADMGLRPATVWASKHLVWLVRAVISVLAIFCILLTHAVFAHSSVSFADSTVPLRSVEQFAEGVWMNMQHPNSMPAVNSGLRLVGRSIILILTMYAVGQVCSQLIRSTIVSIFVAFLLALAAFGWAGACWWFDVPFILSVLPLGIGCLLVTWFRTRSWMLDDNRPRAWALPAGSLVAAIAVAYFATGLFRVYQIPWAEPFIVDANSTATEFNDGLTSDQRAAVLAPVSEEERKTLELYRRASSLLGNKRVDQRSGTKKASEIWDALAEEDQASVGEAIRFSLAAAELPVCADFGPATNSVFDVAASNSSEAIHDAVDLILFDARRSIDAGSLDEALDRYRSAFAASRHAAGRGAEREWWSSHQLMLQTLNAIQSWGSDPRVDAGLVEEATRVIDDHQKQVISIEVVNYASALMVYNTLDANTLELVEFLGDSDRHFPVLLGSRFPGERARGHRLLNLQESYDVASMASYRSHQAAAAAGAGVGMASWHNESNTTQSVHARVGSVADSLSRTTPLFALIASGSARGLCLTEVRTECHVRATKLLLQLLAEQRESESLPKTLEGFGESLNDPWTDKPFVWYPEGLPADLKRGSNILVEAKTPFLMTGGHSQPSIRRVEYEENNETSGQLGAAAMGSGLQSQADGSSSAPGSDDAATDVELTPGDPNEDERELQAKLEAGKIRVEYILDASQYVQDVLVWKLPKKNDTKDGTAADADAPE